MATLQLGVWEDQIHSDSHTVQRQGLVQDRGISGFARNSETSPEIPVRLSVILEKSFYFSCLQLPFL